MKRLVFLPSDPIEEYLKKKTYKEICETFNQGGYFDEVYCPSPWVNKRNYIEENVHFIKAHPYQFRKIIKGIKPDVVRAYGGFYCADWATISKVKGIPVLVSVHDVREELIYDSIKYADGVICMSKAVNTSVLQYVE